ncbi:MAG: alpha-L-fucosidase [Clostridia bacterium]
MSDKLNRIFTDVTIERLDKKHGNNPASEEEFLDMGLGMFIHWSIDAPVGADISHWMIGADREPLRKIREDIPPLFFPEKFNPESWARLAKTSGMKYMVFTAKHHGGFCMFDTRTTSFNVMNTAFGRDVLKEVYEAFRKYGIATGLYFSPLDFTWCLDNEKELHFATHAVLPANNPGLMAYNETQIREIFDRYSPIRTVFFDGPPANLKDIVWNLSPDTVITRSEMPTPENDLPDEIVGEPWEACHRLGNAWSYKSADEDYMTGHEAIMRIIKTRAYGGNLLLNVSPDPYGEIPFEQDRIFREIGLFMFFNEEAVHGVRPWHVPREDFIYYTRKHNSDTVYAFNTRDKLRLGERSLVTLKNVRITEKTRIEVVGQSGNVLEHRPEEDTRTRFHQDENGLHIDAMRCYRPYSSRDWKNPICYRITHALKPND